MVADSEAIPEGEVVAFDVNGSPIAIARNDSLLYAFDDSCTHEECPLSEGWIEGTDIECERHGARFDLATGAVTLPPAAAPLVVHAVTEREGKVYVVLAEAAVQAG